jgi:hypothetical protein
MKQLFIISTFLFLGSACFAQDCDSLVNYCYKYLTLDAKKGKVFISDGQVYQAFVDAEQSAEFKTTFYGGTTYRIATTAGTKGNFVIFNIYDQDRTLLFSNMDHKDSKGKTNVPYWDFKVENTVHCYVEAMLDIDKKVSGCLVLLIGFSK